MGTNVMRTAGLAMTICAIISAPFVYVGVVYFGAPKAEAAAATAVVDARAKANGADPAERPRYTNDDLRYAAVSREGQGMTAGDAAEAAEEPVIIEEKGVSFSPSDGPVEEFLGLTLPCTEAWGVSVKEFMQMRARQAPSMGIRQSYKLLSVESHGKQVILVLEDTMSASGKPLPGIPMVVTYQYVYDWPNVQLVAARPSAPAADPLAFFRARRSVACDFKLRAMRS